MENYNNNRGHNINRQNYSNNPNLKKNYISENRNKVINNEIPQKLRKIEVKENLVNKKNYGKVPNYLQKYRQDAEDKKELE